MQTLTFYLCMRHLYQSSSPKTQYLGRGGLREYKSEKMVGENRNAAGCLRTVPTNLLSAHSCLRMAFPVPGGRMSSNDVCFEQTVSLHLFKVYID